MKIDIDTGLLENVEVSLSPNYDDRPDHEEVALLVVHNISLPPGEFGGSHIKQFFMNKLDKNEHPYFNEIADLTVSAHVLIERDGTIIQFVPFHHRAWHAGESSFQGKSSCNDYSIGIELEGDDNIAFTDVQYAVLSDLTKVIMKTYPKLTHETIVGHSDISPGRKTDPGPSFDWQRYLSSLERG